MKATELSIPGAWEFVPQQYPDDRGTFLVWYDATVFADVLGFTLDVAQANHSVSRRDVVRGVHWADVPPGQGKYVYCPRGAVLDVVVDLRVGSPTFGRHETVRLDPVEHRALYLSEGLGHAFVSLADDSVLCYLCSTGYNPGREHVVNALDPDLALPLPADRPLVRSARDTDGPGLAELAAAGRLPSYEQCQQHYRELRSRHRTR
ncbi:dTDP-4-dehydrorhamnose 3,5-epimerase family protein [Micromonospora echinofusca]|uniref:dTDP-4-dehydrorhamnose 3,5-epimerase n=1 Tax=Micromonospora echinofusca TaxID=47858 RepID=A0ABS3VJ41_MICEH|nr:dTDP-4-dehydrorhamnose 3,5-epimerase family protein [Micromonospora echinofusca]MBO4204539.1 dTDP-4-dehydrorhamnose 3,5-epimerase [Micromonospora echinofusca]